MKSIAVIVATCGDDTWRELAQRVAIPSLDRQAVRPDKIVRYHGREDTVEQARNIAASLCATDWLCFLDGDDELESGYIAAMQEAIVRDLPARRIIAPGLEDIDARTGKVLQPRRLPNTWKPMTEMNHCCIGTLVPKELFDAVGGFHEGYRPWEDWELWLRCIRAGACIDYCPDAVYLAHVRPDSRHRSITQQEANELHHRISSEHAIGIA